MNRALLDNPLDKWEEEIDKLRVNQINTENWFKKCVSKLTKDFCGECAADNQKKYMNDENPNDVSMNEFFTKLLQMNNMMIVLDPNATKHSTTELSKIVEKVLPDRLAIDCINQGEKKLTTESDVKTLLSTLEEADAISTKFRNAKEKRSNNHDRNGESNNEQWKKDHSKINPR